MKTESKLVKALKLRKQTAEAYKAIGAHPSQMPRNPISMNRLLVTTIAMSNGVGMSVHDIFHSLESQGYYVNRNSMSVGLSHLMRKGVLRNIGKNCHKYSYDIVGC